MSLRLPWFSKFAVETNISLPQLRLHLHALQGRLQPSLQLQGSVQNALAQLLEQSRMAEVSGSLAGPEASTGGALIGGDGVAEAGNQALALTDGTSLALTDQRQEEDLEPKHVAPFYSGQEVAPPTHQAHGGLGHVDRAALHARLAAEAGGVEDAMGSVFEEANLTPGAIAQSGMMSPTGLISPSGMVSPSGLMSPTGFMSPSGVMSPGGFHPLGFQSPAGAQSPTGFPGEGYGPAPDSPEIYDAPPRDARESQGNGESFDVLSNFMAMCGGNLDLSGHDLQDVVRVCQQVYSDVDANGLLSMLQERGLGQFTPPMAWAEDQQQQQQSVATTAGPIITEVSTEAEATTRPGT